MVKTFDEKKLEIFYRINQKMFDVILIQKSDEIKTIASEKIKEAENDFCSKLLSEETIKRWQMMFSMTSKERNIYQPMISII